VANRNLLRDSLIRQHKSEKKQKEERKSAGYYMTYSSHPL